ncbi:hypothetical protein G7046_g4160 [Stylonectria norvegica]|nr:hypothetical protein G7046_g4160 [Stylonectria norvegica]
MEGDRQRPGLGVVSNFILGAKGQGNTPGPHDLGARRPPSFPSGPLKLPSRAAVAERYWNHEVAAFRGRQLSNATAPVPETMDVRFPKPHAPSNVGEAKAPPNQALRDQGTLKKSIHKEARPSS